MPVLKKHQRDEPGDDQYHASDTVPASHGDSADGEQADGDEDCSGIHWIPEKELTDRHSGICHSGLKMLADNRVWRETPSVTAETPPIAVGSRLFFVQRMGRTQLVDAVANLTDHALVVVVVDDAVDQLTDLARCVLVEPAGRQTGGAGADPAGIKR